MQRRLSGGDRERSNAAFEFGDALFENCRGRVGNPAVAIALRLEVEQGGAVIGAVPRVTPLLVDRNGDGFSCWSGIVAGVDCNRFVAHGSPLRSRSHLTMRFFAGVLVRGGPASR